MQPFIWIGFFVLWLVVGAYYSEAQQMPFIAPDNHQLAVAVRNLENKVRRLEARVNSIELRPARSGRQFVKPLT